jgi:hypothetical protein
MHPEKKKEPVPWFERVIVNRDRATFAPYLVADVYILRSPPRDQGLCPKWLLEAVQGHAELQGLSASCWRRKTHTALYTQFGFKELANPARMMEILKPDVYAAP